MATKSTRKKQNTTKKPKKKQNNTVSQRDEILILIIFGVCILMLLSNFGIGGIAGNAISSILFGLIGVLAYLLPFILFGVVAFAISNKGNTLAYIKIIAAIVLFFLLCAFFELIMHPYDAKEGIFSYYQHSSQYKTGGGFLGGCIVKILCSLVGVVGTYVTLLILGVISVVLITERSVLAPLSRGSKKAYADVRKKQRMLAEKRAEQRERQRMEEQLEEEFYKRSDRKVSGVSFATTLEREEIPSAFEELDIEPEIELEEEPVLEEENSEDSFVIHRPQEMAMDTDIMEITPEITSDIPIVEMPEPEEEIQKEPVKKRTKAVAAEVETQTADVEKMIQKQEEKPKPVYHIPPMELLTRGKKGAGDSDEHLRATAQILEQTLQNFGVRVHVTNASCGPSVTRYELQPEQGVKVSKIVGLADDIKLNLAAADIRIEAPIPGKAAVGIEVPNKENVAVMLRDLLESNDFKNSKANIPFAVGKDIAGKVVVADIAKMPHLLVAGATGSGKSVCINTLIMSILYHADPEEVKLIMVDPKVVELSVYNGIPHLLIPVVTDPKKAAGALNWAVAEMMKRYQLFAEYNVRDLKGFNDKVEQLGNEEGKPKKLPKIVIIVDELADLMMVAPGEVEGAICRLAQLARAAGLHLIIATQRPSVNVITGLIKANMPSRIAFSVSSGVDSRTIIDMNGAEKLLGKGDMLFYPTGYPKPVRVQGSFVSDKEVQKVVDYLIENHGKASYSEEIEEHVNADIPVSAPGMPGAVDSGNDRDAYFADAGRFIIEKEKASIGMLQRMFKIGFNRAARIMDQLAEAGVVGEEVGTKPRKVLMTKEEFEQYIQENL
ncbi:MAG: DNA translocase FtsK [Candidatus Ruminococcus intestinipullorum]|nr:DNA translocase FtsK [Candidatus Ruminococcus intestinipullorum]